jgi:hypothetical protein
MSLDRDAFLSGLLGRCAGYGGTTCLTFTILHPSQARPSPSRHVRVGDTATLSATLQRLDEANRHGWGAYLAIGLRQTGLSRWRRGGMDAVVALPAVFVDVDDPSTEALARLKRFPIAPSCIVHSGGGYHAYWWLDRPTTDLDSAGRVLHALAAKLGGDRLSVAQSLRWVGSVNTKPARQRAVCRLLDLTDRRYPLADFTDLLPRPQRSVAHRPPRDPTDLVAALTLRGYRRCGEWLNGSCPYPHHHKHGDRRPSFGLNTRTGWGFCHVCGSLSPEQLRVAFACLPPTETRPCPRPSSPLPCRSTSPATPPC